MTNIQMWRDEVSIYADDQLMEDKDEPFLTCFQNGSGSLTMYLGEGFEMECKEYENSKIYLVKKKEMRGEQK